MNLTNTQLIILGEASNRDDRTVILPDRLKEGAAAKAVDKLLRAKLIQEIPASGKLPAWRRDDDEGNTYALRITNAGLRAISADQDRTGPSPVADVGAPHAGDKSPHARSKKQAAGRSPSRRIAKADPSQERKERGSRKGSAGHATRAKRSRRGNLAGDGTAGAAPREGSKIAGVIDMLRHERGASVQEIMSTTGWLPHTVRAALTDLRKRGLVLERAKEPRGKETATIDRIAGA
jgi:hypothetical protein